MAGYRVRVSTGPQPLAGTMDAIALTLVGTRGCSPRTPLERWGPDFAPGSVRDPGGGTPSPGPPPGGAGGPPEAWALSGGGGAGATLGPREGRGGAWRRRCPVALTPSPRRPQRGEFRVAAPRALGRLLLARVHKGPFAGLPESAWFLESLCVWPEGAEPPTATPAATPAAGPTVTGEPEAEDDADEDDDDAASDAEDASDSEEEEETGDEDTGDEDTGDGGDAWDAAEAWDAADAADDAADDAAEDAYDTEEAGDAGDAGDTEEDEAPPGPFHFPCYRWLQGYGTWELAEGTAKTPAQERHPLLQRLRRRHLAQQRRRYRLAPSAPGLPWALPLGTPRTPTCATPCPRPPPSTCGGHRPCPQDPAVQAPGFLDRPSSWQSLEAITRVFCCFRTPVTEYVVQHWRDDAFFGEQYLSGVNPVLLRRCSRLPPNFPVTPPMVAPSLGPATCLQREMEEGNIYLADYGVLEGLPTAEIDGRPTYVAAPLCLLHQRPDGQLLPIAIQLSQQPGPRSPIFLPGDPPWVGVLAKAWVRSAEFHVHEGLSHLLRAHLLGEVYALATLRHLPPPHPLFKLLVPHTRFTVHVATLARRFLLKPGGVFDRAVALGRRGLLQLLARGLRELHYTALVLPRDLRRRGVTHTRRYYFAEDARRIWAAIRSFVKGIVRHYYPCDAAVRGDPELQAWVGEIFHKGFLGRRSSGVPSRLASIPRLVTFLTAIIFSCSAHHAATNSGQFELGAFMPNMPAAMREPPPQTKEPLTEARVLAALPAMNTTAAVLGVLWVLRDEPLDMRPLGCYPEHHFTEEPPRRLIRRFRRRLAAISRRVRRRNAALARAYPYLDPARVENSAAI
ncbi:polyunsaturated fatty acid lipoxygenase ALOX8-like [Ciconia boyciana]|uniref:polyunsaturated fatty acid lipoxygenase ALOX8-like n=1 Tax=Ciconia boyciana TaxID=52775 RepID=UPI003BA1F0E6